MHAIFTVENDVVIDKPQVCRLVGLSRATIDRQVAKGYFPRPLKLSSRRVGWRRSQIETWLQGREHSS